MRSSSSISVNRWGAALLLITGAASAATGFLLWLQGDWLLAVALEALALALAFRSSRYFNRWRRVIRLSAIAFGILTAVAFINPILWSERTSSFNQAIRAAGILQNLVKRNQEYATSHGGSFARRLDELTGTAVVGQSYTIVYSPVEDPDHVIRHYSLRAAPLPTYWIRLYADETGVIRRSDTGPADRNSPALQ